MIVLKRERKSEGTSQSCVGQIDVAARPPAWYDVPYPSVSVECSRAGQTTRKARLSINVRCEPGPDAACNKAMDLLRRCLELLN
ncbi:hypothetical protein L798_07876 [Zootermopsis nevadensis]|uniref:Uncharacterized protein n=1 Tax=Zootermopsis nevadensis TaxID=136037 RepID=A0A067RCI4_ZOONE|nr:hypothetical protein L798_07876 [Zootermopsis nevadensis]